MLENQKIVKNTIILIYFLNIWLYESNYTIWIGMFQNSYKFIIYLPTFLLSFLMYLFLIFKCTYSMKNKIIIYTIITNGLNETQCNYGH